MIILNSPLATISERSRGDEPSGIGCTVGGGCLHDNTRKQIAVTTRTTGNIFPIGIFLRRINGLLFAVFVCAVPVVYRWVATASPEELGHESPWADVSLDG